MACDLHYTSSPFKIFYFTLFGVYFCFQTFVDYFVVRFLRLRFTTRASVPTASSLSPLRWLTSTETSPRTCSSSLCPTASPRWKKLVSFLPWLMHRQTWQFLNSFFFPWQTQESGGSYTFKCQHGPMECVGNIIQGCIIKHIPDNDIQVHTRNSESLKDGAQRHYLYIHCSMRRHF